MCRKYPSPSDMKIRAMKREDTEQVLEMMRVFYDSPAVFFKAPDEILRKDIEDCVSDMPLIEGFILEESGKIAGYAMAARCYSTEFGGVCIWLEDLYIKPDYRRQGLSGQFFAFLEDYYKDTMVRLKLEVEEENIAAIGAYKAYGMAASPYLVMTKEYRNKR